MSFNLELWELWHGSAFILFHFFLKSVILLYAEDIVKPEVTSTVS